MRKQVLIRGLDAEVYRRAKAAAALLGLPMGAAVGEALTAWASQAERTGLERELGENHTFVQTHWGEIEQHRGKIAVVASGKLQGVFGARHEARKLSSRFRLALTFAIEGTPTKHEVEFGPEMALQ